MAAQLPRQCRHHPLGTAVRTGVRRSPPRAGGHPEQVAAPGRRHEGQGGVEHVAVAVEVHGQDAQPVLLAALGVAHLSGDAGDVHHRVEPLEVLHRGLDGECRDIRLGQVTGGGAGIDAFRRELPDPLLTVTAGLMVGGTPATLEPGGARGSAAGKTNIVAERAVARGDLRALTPDHQARAVARMQAIVAQHLPKTGATLAYDESYPPMAPTAGNRALLAMLNQVNADLGLPTMGEWDPAKRGAADSSFVAADADVLAGLGAAGSNSHAEGETVDLASITRQALRSAALIGRLARTPR